MGSEHCGGGSLCLLLSAAPIGVPQWNVPTSHQRELRCSSPGPTTLNGQDMKLYASKTSKTHLKQYAYATRTSAFYSFSSYSALLFAFLRAQCPCNHLSHVRSKQSPSWGKPWLNWHLGQDGKRGSKWLFTTHAMSPQHLKTRTCLY